MTTIEIKHHGCADIYDSPPVKKAAWLWDGFFRSGLPAVLAGHGEAGKGILMEQLFAHIPSGKPLFGRAVGQGRALYISAEDDMEELRARLYDISMQEGIEAEDLANLELRSTLDMGVPPALLDANMRPTQLLNAVRDYCRSYPDIVAVGLDTISAFAPAGIELKSNSSAVTQYISTVATYCKPAATIFTAHLTKPAKRVTSRPTIDDVRDSSAIVSSARSVMILHQGGLTLDKCNSRYRTEEPILKTEIFNLCIQNNSGFTNGTWRHVNTTDLSETRTVPAGRIDNPDKNAWREHNGD
jgi:RecA-family ATPase